MAPGEDHTATFAAGDASVTVTVHPALGGAGADVALLDGADYEVGTPSSGSVDASVTTPSCPSDLLTDDPSNSAQTIHLGEAPAPLILLPGIGGVSVVRGALPSGLTLDDDGTWSGTADETGTFTVTLCFPDPVCAAHGAPEFTLTVLPRAQVLPRTGTFAARLVLLGLAVLVLGIGLQRLSAARVGS